MKNLKTSRNAVLALLTVVAIVAIGSILGSLFVNGGLVFIVVGVMSVATTSIYRHCATTKVKSGMKAFEVITIIALGAILGSIGIPLWISIVATVISLILLGLFIFGLTGKK